MKNLLKIFFAALFVGITEAVNRCGEYIDKETVLVRRTTDGKFSAEISDDLAGSTVFGTGKGLFTHGRAIFLSRMLVNEFTAMNGPDKLTVNEPEVHFQSNFQKEQRIIFSLLEIAQNGSKLQRSGYNCFRTRA